MSSIAMRKLLLIAREKFAADFGADPAMFDSSFWDVSCFRDRAFNRTNRHVYFTRYGSNDQPLPPDYSGVVKSWLILDRRTPGNMGLRLAGARILWEAILARRGGDPEAFRWPALSEEDLSQAELLMRVHWAESTTYKRMMSLLVFVRFLASRNLCRPLYYTAQTPRVEDFNRHTIAGQEARRDRLPTGAVLNGLADIYREHAVEPRDKLRAAALAILVVTGFRIGELLTLPLDCEVRETSGGQLQQRLRDYLAIAEGHGPDEKALDVRSVAAALGVSPTTLYKYGFNNDVNAAEQRQRENGLLSGAAIEQRFFEDQLVQLKAELEREQERNRQLVGRVAIIEANAGRLGIDPEELYRAILKPVRSMSRAGSNMNGARKRFRRS